jgi:hypothetical protein
LPIFASGLHETRRKPGDMAAVRSTLLSSAPSIVDDPFDHVRRAESHPKSCFVSFLSLKKSSLGSIVETLIEVDSFRVRVGVRNLLKCRKMNTKKDLTNH